MQRVLLLCATALTLSACAVAPQVKTSSLPPAGPFVAATSAVSTAGEVEGEWWRLYQDPALDGLVASALEHNRDLAAAAANLEQVRASLSETRGQLFPSTTVAAGYDRGRLTTAQAAGGPRDYDAYTASLGLNYEFDLFGRVRSAIAAARADAGAAEAALDLVKLTVAPETARAYADACSAKAQLSVAENTLDLQSRTARLIQTQFDNGRGNGLTVASANAAAQTTRATLSPLRAAHDAALFRLSVLTGQPPEQQNAAAGTCAAAPTLNRPIPVGDGAGLIARRPDVRQAQRRLEAATARSGVAIASLYPTITLGGSLASTAARAGDIGNGGSINFSLGPLISWSFPNLVAAKARVAGAQAGADVALAQFDATVLGALRDTETALSAYGHELDRRAALQAARDEAAKAAQLSQQRYDQGADSFLTLLDAQRTLAGAEAALAQSNAQVAADQITLFQALGGGWQAASSR